MMRAMLNVLEVFHHRSARHIVGMMVQRTASGEWEWPAVADALETAGLWPTKEYIYHIQDTIVVQVFFWNICEM